jgi:hypothetical protein
MNREQVEHVLRAAGAITGRTEWVLVGSQAILGPVPDAPLELTASEELDLTVQRALTPAQRPHPPHPRPTRMSSAE